MKLKEKIKAIWYILTNRIDDLKSMLGCNKLDIYREIIEEKKKRIMNAKKNIIEKRLECYER